MAEPPKIARKFSARRFAVGAMVCPACRRRLEEPPERCPHCGFTGADCIPLFPFAAPPLEEVIDPAGLLESGGLREVKSQIARLRRRCRQIRWCLCLVNLAADTDLRLFGFWLLNSAQPPADDPEAAAWTVLLLVDTSNGAASVSAGYAVEPFVGDDAWMRAAAAMADLWRRGQHAQALGEFLDAAGYELQTAAWRAAQLQRAMKGGEA